MTGNADYGAVDRGPLWHWCLKCQAHYLEQPLLIEAFASVAIEHDKSSHQLAADYFETYHASRHALPPIDGSRA